jgi:N-acetylmuramoyl-L-alanine amidase
VARRLLLKSAVALRAEAFLLDPVPPYGHRLVIDLYPVTDQKNAAEPAHASADKREVIVAIDAGHGGEDPGAVGAGGILEAEVVLQLARRIAEQLEATPGLRALLVRDGDYYVPRRERMQKARASRADLFVSVHADAFKDPNVAGASVFALSSGGASSELARWLAAKESRSDLIGGVAGSVKLRDKDETLARVILDLSLEAQMNASLHLADAIRAALADKVELHRSGVEQADFEVLKSPDIPSVLVETGFLSNPAEARRLADGDYQARVAASVATGILAYVRRNPPPGSRFAATQFAAPQKAAAAQQEDTNGKRRHVISRGETLSTLAEFYGITTGQLRQANRLAGDRIRVGQVLLIPGVL